MKKINIINEPGGSTVNKTGNWRVYRPVIDPELCIGCGNCGRICPEGVCYPNPGELKNKKNKIYFSRDLDFCKGCGLCAEVCPVKAIKMVREEGQKDK